VVEGLLWGTCALFHIHSFLFLSLIFALWAIAQRMVKAGCHVLLGRGARHVVRRTPYRCHRAASLVWLKPGWLIERQNAVVFLAVNFGFFLILAGWAMAPAIQRRSREHLLILGPAVGLFALLFVVMLAPSDWDNTKVMAWCYLLLRCPRCRSWSWIGSVFPSEPRPGRCSAFLGFVCVASSLRGRGYDVARVDERNGVCAAARRCPRTCAWPPFRPSTIRWRCADRPWSQATPGTCGATASCTRRSRSACAA
jgi:hypothetical protein